MRTASRIALAVALFAALPAQAYDLWITSTVASYHFDNPAAYNQFNPGLGLAWRPHERIELAGGIYENSFYRGSAYAAVVGYSKWLQLGLGTRARVGLGLGAVTGYQASPQPSTTAVHYKGYPQGLPATATPEPTGEHKVAAIALPVLSFERGRFGVDLSGAPKVGPKGVAFIGFGVRFGF